ncbi:MAG: hypothetical protein ORN49_07265 [Rhodobacteraceae bacterium]|nr:hypothetical protein [Paracoccaceae bacterium]
MGKAMTMTASASHQHQDGALASVADVAQALQLGRLPDAPLHMPTQRLVRDGSSVSFLRSIFFGPLGPAGT